MKKILLALILLLILSYTTSDGEPLYPRNDVKTGKLELTNPYWTGLIKEGYTYGLHLEKPFLPFGFPKSKSKPGMIIEAEPKSSKPGMIIDPEKSEKFMEPYQIVIIYLRIPAELQEKAKSLIGMTITVCGLLKCPFDCYMEVEKIELAE